MPYTQSPLDRQLMKKEEIRIGLPWRLLTIAFLTFGITLAIYLGMAFGFRPFLNNQIENINIELDQLANSISEDQAQGFLIFYSQMVNIDKTLKSRGSASKTFDFLEKNTLKSVYYNNMNVDYPNRIVRLEGRAPDFEILAQQMGVLKNSPEIEKITLSNASLSEDRTGGVRFIIQINFKK